MGTINSAFRTTASPGDCSCGMISLQNWLAAARPFNSPVDANWERRSVRFWRSQIDYWRVPGSWAKLSACAGLFRGLKSLRGASATRIWLPIPPYETVPGSTVLHLRRYVLSRGQCLRRKERSVIICLRTQVPRPFKAPLALISGVRHERSLSAGGEDVRIRAAIPCTGDLPWNLFVAIPI